MNPFDPEFPVGEIKKHILSGYSDIVGYSEYNYDVEFTRDIDVTDPVQLATISSHCKYLDLDTAIMLKTNFLDKNKPVLLTVGYPGHAVAYIAHNDNLYVFDTQKTETNNVFPDFTHAVFSALLRPGIAPFNFIDVLSGYPGNLQDDDDLCVIWMLFILETSAKILKSTGTLDLEMVFQFMNIIMKKGAIEQIMEKYKDGKSAFSGGLRQMKSKKTTKKWIQEVVSHMKKGAFTIQALKHHETPEEYSEDVLKHPKKHSLKTRRRAQFLKNIKRKTSHARR